MHSAKGLEFPIVWKNHFNGHIRAIKSDDDHEMEEKKTLCSYILTCDFSYVIWTFTSKSTITLLKRNP